MLKKFVFLILLLFLPTLINAQNQDYKLGTQTTSRGSRYGAYYDYSDPEALNIKVNVWGFVRYPGKYMVPDNTSAAELLSFAGGPTDDSDLDELRIFRITKNNREVMVPFDYNDLMWSDKLDTRYRKVPKIEPGDVLIVPGSPRMYFRDWFGIGLSVFSALTQLTILILTLTK